MAAGSSLAICMRFSSSRQESPASTRMRVRLLETRVLFPLEPEASTVIRIISKAYALDLLIQCDFSTGVTIQGTPSVSISVKSAPRFAPQPAGIDHANKQRARPVFGV